KSGLDILNLSYNTLSPDRAAIFKQIDNFIDDKNTALVCHSMGGLVARAYLAANSEQSQNVTKVITLGTPHKGSHIARRMQQKGFDVFLK
ncbi:alpha/beta fold hydrolase, partial [Bacillus paranthracis]